MKDIDWLMWEIEVNSGYETEESLRKKLPARGARKPNADEQCGDLGDVNYPDEEGA